VPVNFLWRVKSLLSKKLERGGRGILGLVFGGKIGQETLVCRGSGKLKGTRVGVLGLSFLLFLVELVSSRAAKVWAEGK
jgi:hypothetical protein